MRIIHVSTELDIMTSSGFFFLIFVSLTVFGISIFIRVDRRIFDSLSVIIDSVKDDIFAKDHSDPEKQHQRHSRLNIVATKLSNSNRVAELHGNPAKFGNIYDQSIVKKSQITLPEPNNVIGITASLLRDNNGLTSQNLLQAQDCSETTRIERIRKMCVDRGWEENMTRISLDFILTDDKHRMLYCPIPKVACSTFKHLLIDSSGIAHAADINVHVKSVQESFGIKTLASYSQAEINYRLDNYFKFLVVRHPFDRLMSTFHEKFDGNPLNYATFYSDVVEEHFGDYMARDSRDRILVNVSQFLELVATEPIRFYDRHWKSYHRYCHPCSIQYDHVVYLETLEDDIGTVMDHFKNLIGTKSVLSYHNMKRNASDRLEEVYRVFSDLRPEIMARLMYIYEPDFDVFGYTWNQTTGAGCQQCVC